MPAADWTPPDVPFTSLGDAPAHFASCRPDDVAVHHGEAALTWKDLNDRSDRLAAAFHARGVGVGDLVTFALPNGFDVVVGSFACWRIGAVPQVLSMNLAKEEFHAIVELAQPKVVLTTDGGHDGCPAGTTQATVGALIAAAVDGATYPTALSPSWKAPTSGGSTGRPKVILSGYPAVVDDGHLLVWDVMSSDHMLISAPMHHNSPFTLAMQAIAIGATVTLMDRFDPEGVLAEVERRKVTWLYAVPTMMRRIIALPEPVRRRYDLGSLRDLWHVGAPCPDWLKQAWIDWIGPEKVWELYAGTETQAGTRIRGDEWLAHRGSVGPVIWGEMKVLDDEGRPVPTGEIGEVYMRRPGERPYSYIGAEAKALDGWDSLGDLGRFDDDGYLYLHDRLTDMILVGGENIYPAEIEAALDEFPGVRSSAVVGLPDEDVGNRLHAILEADDDLDLESLTRFLRERLSPRKRPVTLEQVNERLRDEAGKMRRAQLRAARIGSLG